MRPFLEHRFRMRKKVVELKKQFVMKTLIEEVQHSVKHWWLSLLVGVLAIIVGIVCIAMPFPMQALATLGALTVLFIVSFLVSGLFELIFAIVNRNSLSGWGWLLMSGLVDLILGIMLLSCPAPVATVSLIYFVGFWILFHSLWAIGSAFELRSWGIPGWGWSLTFALLSLIFAIIFVFSSPLFGGAFIVTLVPLSVLAYGVFRIYLAFRLRAIKKEFE